MRLPEAEEIGLVGVGLLDDDRQVLEPGLQLGREGVERPPDVLLERHLAGWSGCLT
jgi:hypothetical protein